MPFSSGVTSTVCTAALSCTPGRFRQRIAGLSMCRSGCLGSDGLRSNCLRSNGLTAVIRPAISWLSIGELAIWKSAIRQTCDRTVCTRKACGPLADGPRADAVPVDHPLACVPVPCVPVICDPARCAQQTRRSRGFSPSQGLHAPMPHARRTGQRMGVCVRMVCDQNDSALPVSPRGTRSENLRSDFMC